MLQDKDGRFSKYSSNVEMRKPDPKLLPKEGEQYPVMELSEWSETVSTQGGSTFNASETKSRKRARSESPEPE